LGRLFIPIQRKQMDISKIAIKLRTQRRLPRPFPHHRWQWRYSGILGYKTCQQLHHSPPTV
jgi:hypothetical protein